MCKGVTFRVLATLTTVIVSYVVTGAMTTALKIGPLDFVLKLAVFYAHERIWLQPRLQAVPRRSLAKMWSWKAIALSMTVGTTIAVTGRADLALKLGPLDFFLKLFLFYAHERIWDAIPYGRRLVSCEEDQKKTQ
ncbi:Hypothetical Protein FCC1311_007112 [Hondaea fermentalgiana]|uniref:DUF2061 domain-containing protein n=1 Tax=Hondaea fermentalgiana TaxID=2315210 RepID=A0A2R5G7P0_9STRA|nr:Hypothetical Protein FCC1311_007112 [Hondaea fermentalgiana]|eukprot:GBG24493.1 Hypothetical Protein FCC1311_007112 [Hondaea fermentalgiana]